MQSSDGRFVLVYNGEIYNHRSLRLELEARGIRFRGNSDTEVLLEACASWGPLSASTRANGMFAFALWDRQERTLALARDRLGIKPLYVGQSGSVILFGSELTALRQHPAFDDTVDLDALASYLRRACVPAPLTIYHSVRKVMPGTVLTVRQDGTMHSEPYWSLGHVARRGLASRFREDDLAEAVEELETLLTDAVSCRMIADVPLGAFLSGGIDSTTVVAIMQRVCSQPVRTYSIGSHSVGYDEAPHARTVADHLGTDHTEFYVEARDALDVIPRLPTMFDEPFADPTQIPTYLVASLARQEVTVALSGDGGDEIFAGYTRHLVGRSRMGRLFDTPSIVRRGASRAALSLTPRGWDALGRLIPARRRPPTVGDQVHKAARVVAARNLDDLYEQLTSHWEDPEQLVDGATEPATWGRDEDLSSWLTDPTERMLYRDTMGYLPDDALTKVDRTTMAASLEGRVPLLDHRVVEFAWRLPLELKIRDGRSKWPLRAIVERHVPRELLERPKQGFGLPIDEWLRGPLREWASELLDAKRLRQGFLDPAPVLESWQQHLAGTHRWQYPLWNVLMWQAWHETHTGSPARAAGAAAHSVARGSNVD
jgi:asparagine synthase (glutamine-hydrolysing)